MSVMTHDPQGRYPRDAAFDGLFIELNTQHTVLNVHPTELHLGLRCDRVAEGSA